MKNLPRKTTRRNFLRTSAGFAATLIARDLWAVETPASKAHACDFTELPREGHAAKITRITPDDASYVQTYYDVLPWSPSKRFFACTRVLPLDRNPLLGEKAECCVIDLYARTIRTVYSTVCWGFSDGRGGELGRDGSLSLHQRCDRRPRRERADRSGDGRDESLRRSRLSRRAG